MGGMTQPPDDAALFLPDGDGYQPTTHTRGPWDPRHQHGGAPGALLATCIEAVETPVPMRVVRMTVDLMRPVPLTRLVVRTRITRPGRKVQLVESVLLDGELEVVRAQALRIRDAQLDLSEAPEQEPLPHPPPAGSAVRDSIMSGDAGFPLSACELRFASGAFITRGPAVAWIRLRMPVIAGAPIVPMARVAAAADFGNGVSNVLDWQNRLFINPDLGIWLARHPRGDWVCLDASTQVDPAHGSGLAESTLWDEDGRIGRSVQSLLIDIR